MKPRALVVALVLGGCGDGVTTAAADGGADGAVMGGADARTDGEVAAGLRDARYCEVLAGTLSGGNVVLDVYNTIGLNDCPDAAWRALDVAALRAELAVPVVVLNGPRHWTLDAFEAAALQRAQVRTLGGIAMRVAGRIEVPLAVAMRGVAPYSQQTVRRDTRVRFDAGQRVFELTDAAGAIYVMQSYSLQMRAQTLASLETLGASLMPPTGWSFRTRVLTEPLRVTAETGFATVTRSGSGCALVADGHRKSGKGRSNWIPGNRFLAVLGEPRCAGRWQGRRTPPRRARHAFGRGAPRGCRLTGRAQAAPVLMR